MSEKSAAEQAREMERRARRITVGCDVQEGDTFTTFDSPLIAAINYLRAGHDIVFVFTAHSIWTAFSSRERQWQRADAKASIRTACSVFAPGEDIAISSCPLKKGVDLLIFILRYGKE